MSLRYLIENRMKEPFATKRWIKLWLKRAYRLPNLLKILWMWNRLRWYGATVGQLSIVNADFDILRANRLKIGNNSFISPSVMIALHERVTIGNNVVINNGVKLLTGSHDISDPYWPLKCQEIIVGDYAWLAVDVIILPGVHIGRGAVVGAGAVVRKSIPDCAIVIGNPATIVGTRKIENFKYNPTGFVSAYEAWLGNVREK